MRRFYYRANFPAVCFLHRSDLDRLSAAHLEHADHRGGNVMAPLNFPHMRSHLLRLYLMEDTMLSAEMRQFRSFIIYLVFFFFSTCWLLHKIFKS